METIDAWFGREVFRWRTGAAIAWSLLLLPVVCLLYLGLTCVQVASPLHWLTGFLSSISTGSFLFLVFTAVVTNSLFFIFSSRTYSVIPEISLTRLALLSRLLRPSCLLYMAVCSLTGAVLAWACTGVLGDRYSSLSYNCAENSVYYCINERHLFLVLFGGFMGITYAAQFYLQQQNCLVFPALQQTKYFQVQSKLMPVLRASVGHVVWHIKFFYIGYFFLGNLPADLIADTLSLKFGSEYRLASLYRLVSDVALLWHALLCGVFLQFSWSLGATLYKVYNTEHLEFPISSAFDSLQNRCLVEALSCTRNRLLQALAFFDLNILSKHSPARRSELFSLSQPGGHPHNWNNIVNVCLTILMELSETVQGANWKILSTAPVRPARGDKPTASVTTIGNGHHNGGGGDCKTQEEKDAAKPTSAAASFKDRILDTLKKKPVFHYFLSEIPDAKSRQLFASSQLQIWATEALADLVSASYTEDKYGVVQISLPDILTTTLTLQESVEKHFKMTGAVSRRSHHDQTPGNQPLRYALQTTLKASVYKIINTFGKNIMELRLPPDTEKRLRNFMEYRE